MEKRTNSHKIPLDKIKVKRDMTKEQEAEQAWRELAFKNAGAYDRYYLMCHDDFKSALKRDIEIQKRVDILNIDKSDPYDRGYKAGLDFVLSLLETVKP